MAKLPKSSIIEGLNTVVQEHIFTSKVHKIWKDDELFAFIDFIAEHPKSGAVLQGTNGLRKIRWKSNNKGKRGGARVIYYHLDKQGIVVLMDIYKKSDRETLLSAELNKRSKK